MINDITALRGDKKLVKIISEYEKPICLMHMKGNPKNMQNNPHYNNIIKEIFLFLKKMLPDHSVIFRQYQRAWFILNSVF